MSAQLSRVLRHGGVGQLTAAANTLLDGDVVISNMLDDDDVHDVGSRSSGARTVALCALAKGRRSGEEVLWIPALSPAGVVMGRRVEDAHDDAMKLLRAVRDSAHAVAIGAHRSLRREERLSSFVA